VNFWKRQPPIPVVPDDGDFLEANLIESQARLDRAREKQNSAIPVAESLRTHNSRNHYIQRLELSYGRPTK